MEENPESIVEERQENMVHPTENVKIPTFRTAHFLKPYVTSIDDPTLKFPSPSLSSLPTTFEPSKWHLKVNFYGWRSPSSNWIKWVDKLHSKFHSTWKKVGIYEAIMSSKFKIRRDIDLVFGVVEKWCSETNTFMFPWGEATISLEGIMILGGYPVLGDSVSTPLETDELISVEEELNKVRVQLARSKAKKCTPRLWLEHFMGNYRECEHEAFLALWLSRCVFPMVNDAITKRVIPIAVHLASGKRIALAPPVLASIYRDLSLLKQNIIDSAKKDESLLFSVWSPFQIIQIWALERFVKIRPAPNFLEPNEPRIARWHKMDMLRIENIRLAVDTAGDCFEWRPYAKKVEHWDFPKFYGEKEEWILVGFDLDVELESFGRCLMPCELVGLDKDCTEHYFPHRVAMQFGVDQDIPGLVASWINLDKKVIRATKLYLPSRHFEPYVTTRYFEWRKHDLQEGDFVVQRSKMQYCFKKQKMNNEIAAPPGFPQKCVHSSGNDDIIIGEIGRLKPLQNGSQKKDNSRHDLRKWDRRNDVQFQRISPLTANNEGAKEKTMSSECGSMRAAQKLGDEKIYIEVSSEESENSIKCEDESEENSFNTECKERSNPSEEFEVSGVEMEFRVQKLEKIVAKLKAEYESRFGI